MSVGGNYRKSDEIRCDSKNQILIFLWKDDDPGIDEMEDANQRLMGETIG